jgi:hypothetical protein
MELRAFRLNAPGDFYVADDLCLACTAPEHEAPDLMAHARAGDGHYHCYFRKQPETAEELTRAIRAVAVACCGAVRYGGKAPDVIARLVQLGVGDACDYRT